MSETTRETATQHGCEVVVHWAKAESDIGFCGTTARYRYPAMGGGYMHLCDEHAIPHLNYAEAIHHAV